MVQGRLDKPVYQLPLPLEGIEDAVREMEHLSTEEVRQRSENALAALSALRMMEPVIEIVDDKVISRGEVERAPRWMELYQRLREQGWDWRVAVYIAWSAQPKKYRWPETQNDLALKCLGLTSDRAVATWRKKNPTIDETISMMQGSIIFDALPDAMQAMVEVATTANYKGHQDRKLMFEMGQIYMPSSRLTAEMVKKLSKGTMDASDISEADLREIVAAASSELERLEQVKQVDEEKPE
jgi:hypothetical protein